MANALKIAVLITYHDERAMLRECLQSLAEQSVQPDEILIYDDCSQFLASDYLVADLPVKIIRGTTNVGPSAGRNRLLDECSSDYIHFHDADDLFRANWCESVRSQIVAASPDLVLNDISLFQEGKIVRERFYGFGGDADASDLLRLAIRVTLVPSTATYRAQKVRRVGGYRPAIRYSEDYDFHLRLALSGVNYAVIPEPLILQRAHQTNRSLNQAPFLMGAIRILDHLMPEIPAEYHAEVAEVSANFGSDLYRKGKRRDAREAFDLSVRAGNARFKRHRPMYRFIARLFGQEAAELATALSRPALIATEPRAGA
jgi:GT2 family glycosyltransferase